MDVEQFCKAYDLRSPELNEHMEEVAEHLLERCPIAHTAADVPEGAGGDMWIVSRYRDVLAVLQDWDSLSSDPRKAPGADPATAFVMPPIMIDPPLQRDFRRLLNPQLSPQVVAGHEPGIRVIVGELMDRFVSTGRCELVGQLARPFPPNVFFRLFFGIDDQDQVDRCMGWVHKMDYEPDAPDMGEVLASWMQWCTDLIAERRVHRRDDLIDALLFGSVEGRPVDDAEIIGAIQILILGGFSTTADALSSMTMLLVEHPELQDLLRAEPARIPAAIEEFLRVEPPVVSLPNRICVRETEVAGERMTEGERLMFHVYAANHDPREFDDPFRIDLDRPKNRHLTFGGGPHRCIGSNLARLNLRVVLEEMLARMGDIRIAPGEAPRRTPPTISRGWGHLPLAFEPQS
jgi:cytochrome P450